MREDDGDKCGSRWSSGRSWVSRGRVDQGTAACQEARGQSWLSRMDLNRHQPPAHPPLAQQHRQAHRSMGPTMLLHQGHITSSDAGAPRGTPAAALEPSGWGDS